MLRTRQFRLVFHSRFENFCFKLYLFFSCYIILLFSTFIKPTSQLFHSCICFDQFLVIIPRCNFRYVNFGLYFSFFDCYYISFMLSVTGFIAVMCLSTASWRFVSMILYVRSTVKGSLTYRLCPRETSYVRFSGDPPLRNVTHNYHDRLINASDSSDS